MRRWPRGGCRRLRVVGRVAEAALLCSPPVDPRLRAERERFVEAARKADDDAALYALKVEFLGKKGSLSKLRSVMRDLSPAERKAFGRDFNTVKDEIEALIDARRKELAERRRAEELARWEDVSVVLDPVPRGALHIVTQTWRRLERVFENMGFTVHDGPHVEHGKTNFDDLNIPPDHPARDMQDTFFVVPPTDDGWERVLRTHTSPVQIRTMLAGPPPVRVVALGQVYRRDDDATHTPMFHQIEGLYVDRDVSMADLKATLYHFVSAVFETDLDVRFRPSFFPFVEPGAEFDVRCPFGREPSCAVCKGTGWLELGGSGMVHPAVLRAVGYDPDVVSGWAFGFGIDRMAMLQHGVRDLRLLFEGDRRFLEQFPC